MSSSRARAAVRRAFTLVELLVVVGAVALVASTVVVSVVGTRERARDTRRLEDSKQLQTALELYYTTNLRYPARLDELVPAYIATIPKDPNGSAYAYAALGSASTCGSYHLGANFENAGHAGLQADSDQPAASTCTGSAADFAGRDVASCGGAAGADRCYDIVPEILALQEMGIPPPAPGATPPPPGSQVAGAGESLNFSGGGGTPVFVHADIQPRDVSVGDIQTVTAEVGDAAGIVEMKTETVLDHSVQIKFMSPIDGAQPGCTSCRWRVSWEVNDTSHNTYHTVITAKNSQGRTNSVTLAWTDPCSPGLSGNWTLDGNCTITGVNGVENGNFTGAAGYTMTISAGATWVFNDGYSFSPSGATIAISNSGQISKTELWIRDQDSDGYAPSATDQLAQSTQPTNYISRASASGTNDCYDLDATAKTGQTTYYSVTRGTSGEGNDSAGQTWNSYDYNCDAAETKEYTSTANCI